MPHMEVCLDTQHEVPPLSALYQLSSAMGYGASYLVSELMNASSACRCVCSAAVQPPGLVHGLSERLVPDLKKSEMLARPIQISPTRF